MSPRRAIHQAAEYILMGILHHHPAHGYDLHKEITRLEGIALIWRVKQSLLYALLDKLEHAGLLASTLIAGEARPQRRQYSLTAAGRTAFLEWVESPVTHPREMRQDFLARLYFARLEGGSLPHRLVQRQQAACREWLAGLQAQSASATGFSGDIYRFRITQVEGMLAWLADCGHDQPPER